MRRTAANLQHARALHPNQKLEDRMTGDTGGWLWILVDVIAVVLLAGALAYGAMRWRRRKNPTLDKIRDDATDRLYDKQ